MNEFNKFLESGLFVLIKFLLAPAAHQEPAFSCFKNEPVPRICEY